MEWTPETHEEICSRIPVGKRFTDEEMVGIVDPLAVLDNLSRTTKWAQDAEARAATAEAKVRQLTEQLTPGSPTERAPTQWAYEQACAALAAHQQRAATLEAQVRELQAGAGKWQQAAQNLLGWWTEGGYVGAKQVDFIPQSDQVDAITEFKQAVRALLPASAAPEQPQQPAPQGGGRVGLSAVKLAAFGYEEGGDSV